MEITYSCSPEDYVSYYVWSQKRGNPNAPLWWQRFWSSFHSTAILLFGALVTRDYSEHPEIWKICASFAGVVFVSGLMLFTSTEKKVEKWVNKTFCGKGSYGRFGDKTLRLLENSIWLKDEVSETTFAYRVITEIVETPTHVFIMWEPQACIVPRAKVKNGILEQFIAKLGDHVKTASAACDSISTTQVDKAKRGPIFGRSDFLALITAVVVILLLVSWELVFDASGTALERYGEGKFRTNFSMPCCMYYYIAGWVVAISMLLSLPLFALFLFREKVRFVNVRTAVVLLAVGVTWGMLFGYAFLSYNSIDAATLSLLPRAIDQLPFVVGQPLSALLTWTFDLGWLVLLLVGTALMLYLRRREK